MAEPPPCDLDPNVYIIGSAWYDGRTGQHQWKALMHGAPVEHALVLCACPLCVERLGQLTAKWEPPPPPEPEPPRVVDVEPVRLDVLELLADGLSRQQIAEAAEIDATTVTRLLRSDVKRVSVTTADAVLAVSV